MKNSVESFKNVDLLIYRFFKPKVGILYNFDAKSLKIFHGLDIYEEIPK